MTFYTLLEDLEGFEIFSFIDQGFERIIINKYINLDPEIDAILNIVLYEIVQYYPICKHEEYIKEVFGFILSSTSNIYTIMKLVNVYNKYSHDTKYKETLYKFMLFKIATPYEHIKLFDLHRKMFDTSRNIIKMEEEILLNEISNNTTECIDLLYLGISYYQIENLEKANKFINKGLKLFQNIDDVNTLNNIIYKIQEYCTNEKNICFLYDVWLKNLVDKMYMIFRKHKNYDEYFDTMNNIWNN